MSATDTGIAPRLDELPAEGKAEYLRWSETVHRLTISYLDRVGLLKEIMALDPAHAAIYEREIESLQKKASATMEQWQGHRGRILAKWLCKN